MNKNKWTRLGDALAEIEKVEKSSVNPHFKSNYADINALLSVAKPTLQKYGFILVQPSTTADDRTYQTTQVIDSEDGSIVLHSSIQMQLGDNPQKNFAMSTYYRRLTLQNCLSMQAEDDDGNTASAKSKPAFVQQKRRNDF